MTKSRVIFLTLITISILFASAQSFAADDKSKPKVDNAKKKQVDPKQKYKEEFLQWHNEVFPKSGKIMERLRKENKKLFEERYKSKEKRLGNVMDIYKRNPDHGKVIVEDRYKADIQSKTLRKIRSEKDEKKKQKYINELKNIVAKRFDLAVKIKQFEFEEFRQRIKRLEKVLANRQKDFEERLKRRDEEIENRTKKLLADEEKCK